MLALNSENFMSTIKDNDTVFVDFWAAWCGPCRQFGPIFERVAAKHDDVVFAKVDTEANQDISAALSITSIPTIMAFRGGYLVYSQPGAMNETAFGQLVEQVKAVSLEEVKAQAEKANAEGDSSDGK